MENDLQQNNCIMSDGIIAAIIMSVIAFAIYRTIKLLSDNRLKRRIIEKSDVNAEALKAFDSTEIKSKYPVLKWGLVTFFAGLSLIIMSIAKVDFESPLPIGIFLVSVSLGFLIYYFYVKREDGQIT